MYGLLGVGHNRTHCARYRPHISSKRHHCQQTIELPAINTCRRVKSPRRPQRTAAHQPARPPHCTCNSRWHRRLAGCVHVEFLLVLLLLLRLAQARLHSMQPFQQQVPRSPAAGCATARHCCCTNVAAPVPGCPAQLTGCLGSCTAAEAQRAGRMQHQPCCLHCLCWCMRHRSKQPACFA